MWFWQLKNLISWLPWLKWKVRLPPHSGHFRYYRLCVCAFGSLITDILNCFTPIIVSLLHFGQHNGKLSKTVFSRIIVLVLFLQFGQHIHSFLLFFKHKPPAFCDYVLNFTAKLHSRKAYKIQNAFQIKQNANTHPHALPVLFLTISIPYIAINVVIISMIPQKVVLNGCSRIQMMAQVNAP